MISRRAIVSIIHLQPEMCQARCSATSLFYVPRPPTLVFPIGSSPSGCHFATVLEVALSTRALWSNVKISTPIRVPDVGWPSVQLSIDRHRFRPLHTQQSALIQANVHLTHHYIPLLGPFLPCHLMMTFGLTIQPCSSQSK